MDTSHRVRSSEVGRLQVACAGDYCLTRERERERERDHALLVSVKAKLC
jgi:hypothetical protein